MKTKLELAHDWAMKHGDAETVGSRQNMIKYAWDYADAMQAEADKRKKEKQSEHVFEAIEEWQPDWSQAPNWAEYWTADELATLWWSVKPKFDSSESWHGGPTADIEKAPSFDYTGDWRESLRKRPK